MHKLESITDEIRQSFDARTAARDRALAQARQLTRACSLAIRAVHRDEADVMQEHLLEAQKLSESLKGGLGGYPDLFYVGYTQDALKEFVEANVTCALIQNRPLLTPAELGVSGSTYLNGLAEVVGELRRRTLDILRHGYSQEAERLLGIMDDIFSVLVTMDYPDAITNGLRRQTDLARSIIEKTRGDITFSLRGEHLEQAIGRLGAQLNGGKPQNGERGPAALRFRRISRMAKAGKRYPLVLYTRMIDRWWPALFLLGLALLALAWWLYQDVYRRLTEPWRWTTMAGVGAVVLLVSLIMLVMRKSAYVQPRADYMLVATPFLRMKISYRRIRRASSANLAVLFPPKSLRGFNREILEPLFKLTAVVVELNALPMPISTLRLFLSPFFFKDKTPHLVILVRDWMAFSAELESMRVVGDEPVQKKATRDQSILSRLPKK